MSVISYPEINYVNLANLMQRERWDDIYHYEDPNKCTENFVLKIKKIYRRMHHSKNKENTGKVKKLDNRGYY